MAQHKPNAYKGMDEDQIRMEMGREGYNPRRVEEAPNTVYKPRKNLVDLLLVFLKGDAHLRVGDEEFHCNAGDRLQIPGNVEYSARVGKDGVVYLLTELELIGD